MTTGAAPRVLMLPIADIIVTDERQRSGTGETKDSERNLDALAASMAKRHLHPIIVRDDMVLVAGYRRLQAAKKLGWQTIAAKLESDLNDDEREELELDENLRRLDLTWQERIDAIARIHALRQKQEPKHGQLDTATELHVHQSDVSDAVQLKQMIELFPELAKADSVRQAKNWAKRLAQQKLRTAAVKAAPQNYADIEEKLVLGDSVEVIKTLPDGSFRTIITDPPFGINFDQLTADPQSYKDDRARYERILTMAPDLYRVLEKDGFLVWWCGFSWYEHCKEVFREAGFTVDEIPLFWDRSDGRCFTTNPDQLFPKGYDIALHAYRGKPIMAKRRASNVFRYAPETDAEQSAERPPALYADLIQHLTYPGERIADFFAGSGSVSIAAEATGRDWFAVELSEDRRARAITKIKQRRPDGKPDP